MTKSEFIDVLDFIEDNDVNFIRLQFSDLFGNNKNISVYYTDFERALDEGIPFISASVDGYKNSNETELVLYPDSSTIMTLPWRPHQGGVARVICNVCHADGSPYEGNPRQVLINVLDKAQSEGYEFEIGAKIEFYLFELDDNGNPTTKPVDQAGFFDLAPLDKGENTRREIILTLEEMGFSIISSHHEDGQGQNEIDFRMADPLTCADNIQTFKSVVKTIAERNGLHASFMPKPLNKEPGSGMHIMITAFKNNENIFTNKEGTISKDGEYFAGGILKQIPGITLFANPIVNSYKRIASSFDINKEHSWNPLDKEAIIRVPEKPGEDIKLIIRTPDGAANPYLLFALLLQAGLTGIKDKTNPEDIMISLPVSLRDAIVEAQNNDFINKVIGLELKEDFLKHKAKEWNDYITTVHDWEIDKYFKSI